MQEVIDLHNDSLIPAAKAQKGWQGSYLMTDTVNGKILSITVWESEAEMLASESGSGYLQHQVAKFDSVFSEPPNFSHYELSAEASAE
jgi:hypothetical protein